MLPARKQNENLSGIVKIVAAVVVVCLGLWGCARKPSGRPSASSDRVGPLESRCQKLEQDCRKARDKAAALESRCQKLEEDCESLRQQVKAGIAARASLQKQLAERTGERRAEALDELR